MHLYFITDVLQFCYNNAMNETDKRTLKKSLDLLSGWLPIHQDILLTAYESHTSGCRYKIDKINSYTYCIFTFPILNEEGKEVNTDLFHDDTLYPMHLLVQLVFDCKMDIIADSALYYMQADQIDNPVILDYLEEESDWLYWESYILQNMFDDFSSKDLILIYSNAYTSKENRNQNIFHQMIQNIESFVSVKEMTVYSVISLDPDIACYGKDKTDKPYIYSMKDEPERIKNAKILEGMGFHPLKLETDEPIEDGSLLWFAWKKTSYIYI